MRAWRGVARWLPGLLVATVTLLAFLQSLQGEFLNWDDDENFLFNPHYRGLGWTQVRWMFTATHSAPPPPRPPPPAGGGGGGEGSRTIAWAAGVAALIFSVPPLRVESVAWV